MLSVNIYYSHVSSFCLPIQFFPGINRLDLQADYSFPAGASYEF